MAYIVPRPADRWELRRAVTTADGPRSVTLASFKELTPEVVAKAVERAGGEVTSDEVLSAARRAGAPVAQPPVMAAAAVLLGEVSRDARLPGNWRRVLLALLGDSHADISDAERAAATWADATAVQRGKALRELLLLANRIPPRTRGPAARGSGLEDRPRTMSAPALPDKVLAIDRALADAKVPHAFRGALALAYYAEPRATIDVDVNVFVEPTEADRVESALRPLGVEPHEDRAALERDAQARWRWEHTPIDLFFNNDPIHDAMRQHARRVPFADDQIPILAPEHLLLCKLVSDRPKDWLDVEQMLLLNPGLERAEVERWLPRLLGDDDPRRRRLAKLLERSA